MRRGIRNRPGIKIVVKNRGKPNEKRYVYHRATGARLPDLPENHPDFLAALAALANTKPASRAAAGSLAKLIDDYQRSPAWRELAAATQQNRSRIMVKIRDARGSAQVAHIEPRHIAKDLADFALVPAHNRRKVWRALFAYAKSLGLRYDNPASSVDLPKPKVNPHRRWQPDHVERFREFWAIGTPQRLAFEVLHWTGARCVDARRLGRQMVTEGWLEFTQDKTGGPVALPWDCELPEWAAALKSDQRHLLECLDAHSNLTFIVTGKGAPRSQKGLSQWFSAAAKEAGLPCELTAHGLRKTRASVLAEIGASATQIGGWTGHESLSEIQEYIREVDRKRAMRGNQVGSVSKMHT